MIGEVWPEYAAALTGVELRAAGERVIDLVGLLRQGSTVLVLAILLHLVPDFVSLWETRAVMGWMAKRGRYVRAIVLDLALTAAIAGIAVSAGCRVFFGQSPVPGPESRAELDSGYSPGGITLVRMIRPWKIESARYPTGRVASAVATGKDLSELAPRFGTLIMPVVPTVDRVHVDSSVVREWVQLAQSPSPWAASYPLDDLRPDDAYEDGQWTGTVRARSIGLPFGVFFYSAFLTSVWLWLYAVSVVLARSLVRAGRGVGFLLKLTDVENHPFRSMGFTSVVLVSLMFLAGLPFVLLR